MLGRGVGRTIVLALLMAAPEPALAQAGSRLSGPEITQTLIGKTLVFRHDRGIRGSAGDAEIFTRTDGVVAELTMSYNADGSYRVFCKLFAPNGSSGPCGGPYSDKGSTAGVWQIRGNTICNRDLVAAASREACFAIERAGTRYRWRYVGPKMVRGPFNSLVDGIEFAVRP